MKTRTDPSRAPGPRGRARTRRPRSFGRALFQILVLGVLVPGALIWAVGHFTARAAVRFLWDNLSQEIADHTVERTLRYLETGNTALHYNDSAVSLDLLDPQDRRALLRYLLAGLRANPNVTWYSFGGADGAYLSAYKSPGGGVRLTWREQVDGGARYRDFLVEEDGTWTALPEQVKPYDPRTRTWYEAATASDGPVWSEPFLFASGPPGFILSRKAQAASGEPIGVWGIEYEMAYVSEFLAGLEIGKTGRAYLLTESGAVIGHPEVGKRIGAPDGWIVVERDGGKAIASATSHRDPWLRRAFAETCCRAEPVRNARFDLDGETFLCAATAFPPEYGLDWLVVLAIPESDILGTLHRNSIYAAVAAILIAAFFLMVGFLQARRRLTRPLEGIAQDLEDMSRLETEQDPRVSESRIAEVAGMVRAREAMRGGLRSFKKYVPADLVRDLMASGQEARLGGEERVLTVMFSDVIGFTGISEELGDPTALVNALSEYLNVMSEIIARHGGTVDKYVGDAILAFWGAPQPHPAHALAACEAAWDSQVMLRLLRDRWSATGHPLFRARIGVNTGDVLVGNIGSAARMNYTVMGDAVNLGSRLEGLCTVYGLEIAIGAATRAAVEGCFETRPVDCVEVKGREQATVFHELLGPCGTVPEETLAFAAAYREAFDLYMGRRFQAAQAGFEAALALDPTDVAARELAARCEVYGRNPPPADWTGAVRLTRKK